MSATDPSTGMASRPRPAPGSGPTIPPVLTWGVRVALVLVAAQFVLGVLMLRGSWNLINAHAGLGYAATFAAALAAISAIVWRRAGGTNGLMILSVLIPILMIIQIGLGEAGVKWVHVVLGSLILIGLGGLLYTIPSRPSRGKAVRETDHEPPGPVSSRR
ncbi:MAG: hypothetical protein LKI24_09540 [Acidipropionibacterium sp.]|jgi:heme A synthase|nr:hypothetical protein [Acidipropionibacterium sp.]